MADVGSARSTSSCRGLQHLEQCWLFNNRCRRLGVRWLALQPVVPEASVMHGCDPVAALLELEDVAVDDDCWQAEQTQLGEGHVDAGDVDVHASEVRLLLWVEAGVTHVIGEGDQHAARSASRFRSEERRVGEEWRCVGAAYREGGEAG